MCGIAGSVNIPIEESTLSLIEHRGPDYQELVTRQIGSNQVFLGHTRLSILDLSEAGNQPMFTDCGKYAIVFNGEVYNHRDLRAQLPGINFRGHSDTETILYYIREYGIDRVNDFSGIFAFAFLDISQGKLYLVRDHFGVKPLYYHLSDQGMVFSSELKILLSAGVKKAIDLPALDTLLALRYNPSPETIFEGISKLNPATYLSYDIHDQQWEKKKYWNPTYKVNYQISEEEAVEEYARLFEAAVKKQLMSDVPVGLFLSGGLDSALVGSIMMQHTSYPVNTFTVGFQGEGNYNELEDARITAELIGSRHTGEFINRKQYLEYFRQSFFHTEEPIAEPTIPALYHVSKMAARKVKVVLSGQGADEPMAGYKRYYGEVLMSKYGPILKRIPYKLARRFFRANESYQRGIYSSQFDNELDRFLAIYNIFSGEMKSAVYNQEVAEAVTTNIKPFFEKYYEELHQRNGDSLNHLLYLDTRTMLPDNLLLFNDKITMAHSIENRVPFLDKDLVAFVESLPSHYKLNGKVRKYLEKKAARKWLPDELINRKKRAFETPVVDWFKEELFNELVDLFNQQQSFSRIYFEREALIKMLQLHRSGKRDFGKQIFILYSLELWYQNFYLKC